ncbi:MAG: hypothetical protein ACRDYX_02630 [Egibacteraceae bacterium]
MRGRPNGHDPTVSRLVMVDLTWAHYRFPLGDREEPIGERYRTLLNGLLGLHEDAADPDAWILHHPQLSEEVERALKQPGSDDPILVPYRWFQDQKPLLEAPSATCRPAHKRGRWWHSGPDATQTVERIADGLNQCGKIATRAWMGRQEALLAAQMNLFACRLYLAPEWAHRKLAPQADLPAPSAHVCIDLRFNERLGERLGRYWLLYATLSAWTHKPSSRAHAPDLAHPTGHSPYAVKPFHRYAGALRKGFKECVREHFPTAETTILGRDYRPPQLWYASGPGLPTTRRTVDRLNHNGLNALADVLLCVPDLRSTGVAAGVIREQTLVLRRFVPDASGELPCYLVFPFRGRTVEQHEDDARPLVWELANLETAAAAQLFDVTTSLDMHRSHLRAYEAVAHQAEEFWDQLSLYLPVARSLRLIRVHKLIELVHQILLQGIGDLDQVTTMANKAKREVERLAGTLRDQFDCVLTERPLPDKNKQSIRPSLTESGYFEKAAREADRVHKDAEQVQRSYETLLAGITRAFDERRVRGSDVIQRVGFWLAVFVVIFAFVPEALNALFTQPEAWTNNDLVRLSRVGVGGFALFALGARVWMWWLGILVSWPFIRLHRRLKKFLSDCQTDRLTRLRDDGWKRVRTALDDSAKDEGPEWDQIFAEWDELDRDLARRCAYLLDARYPGRDPSDNWGVRPPEFKDLARQVQRWGLTTLLVTERPREFWQFPLPRLTFLYRFYPVMGSELRSSFVEATEADVVSDSDFTFTISNQCSGRHDEIDDVKRWALHQVEQSMSQPRPALDFVRALENVGLRAGMTRTEFEAMRERMRAQLSPD